MKIKTIIAASVIAIASMFAVTPVMAYTCPNGTLKAGSSVDTPSKCNIEEDDTLMPTIVNIIEVIIGVLGIAAVVIIVLGGVQFLTSTGDPGKVKKAKDTIMYGIIGLVVAILAFAIVNFVLGSFFSSNSSSSGSGAGTEEGQSQQQNNS